MELNPYSPCPCGSGKQFKWCCQPIHRQITRVFQLDEEAEHALDEAFRINADYAFGYFLKGQFRLNEGEIAGALILLRKAAELYSPEAHDILASVQVTIFDCEMKLNHPFAAHAAVELALKHNPA